MVARALPGGAGSAARARASAACLAAWRAAQGAGPRRPSLRFAGAPPLEPASSVITASDGRVTEFSADDLLDLAELGATFLPAFFGAEAFAVLVFFDMT